MNWGYDHDNGPSTWHKEFPHAKGSSQSPVNIDNETTVVNWGLPTFPLTISYYDEAHLELTNTGRTVVASTREPSILSGGPMKHTYQLEQFHFHWGSTDNQGSEHTVDGHAFPAELHLVHWNRAKYFSFLEAQDKKDGLAVLGIFIQIGAEQKDLKSLTNSLSDIKHSGSSSHVKELFNPRNLLPQKLTEYWTYSGSLTTPPCYESVTWILFKEPMEISQSQLNSLRSLCHGDKDGQIIGDNHRPTATLGDRKMKASFLKSHLTHHKHHHKRSDHHDHHHHDHHDHHDHPKHVGHVHK